MNGEDYLGGFQITLICLVDPFAISSPPKHCIKIALFTFLCELMYQTRPQLDNIAYGRKKNISLGGFAENSSC